MKSWLYVGAKVVCVDASRKAGFHAMRAHQRPVEGETYTVTWVGPSVQDSGLLCVRLAEIQRVGDIPGSKFYGVDIGYRADRFRPVSTIDTTHQVNLLKKLVEKKTVEA